MSIINLSLPFLIYSRILLYLHRYFLSCMDATIITLFPQNKKTHCTSTLNRKIMSLPSDSATGLEAPWGNRSNQLLNLTSAAADMTGLFFHN